MEQSCISVTCTHSCLLGFCFFHSPGDLIDSVKSAAEGVKNHSTSVATWMKKNVSPTLRNILPTSSDSPDGVPQPSTSAAIWTGRPVRLAFCTLVPSELL